MPSYTQLVKLATADDPNFNPIFVGAAEAGTKGVAAIDHKRNGIAGAAVGGGVGLLSWLLSQDETADKDDPEYKKKMRKRITRATGLGLMAGGATYGTMSAIDAVRGSRFSRKYRLPTAEDGETPDIVIHMAGAMNGAHTLQGGKKDVAVESVKNRYGDGHVYLLGPNDKRYAKELLTKIHKSHPNARIRLSGHSHGASSIYEIAKWCAKQGINIDQLDTIDPISWFTHYNGKPGTTARWNNYRPDKYNWQYFRDLTALIGQVHGKLEGSKDHVVTDWRYANHGDIRSIPFDNNTEYWSTPQPTDGVNKHDDPELVWWKGKF